MMNLAYSAAVHSFGSETNLLRYGTRMALNEVQRAWQEVKPSHPPTLSQ